MNFSEALNLLKHGSKIRRKDWAHYAYYFIKDNKIFNQDGVRESYIYWNNVFATDWEEYKKIKV